MPEEEVYCRVCGAEQPPDAQRCSNCGAPIGPAEAEPAPEFGWRDVLGYSTYTILIILVALLVPVVIAVLCLLSAR